MRPNDPCAVVLRNAFGEVQISNLSVCASLNNHTINPEDDDTKPGESCVVVLRNAFGEVQISAADLLTGAALNDKAINVEDDFYLEKPAKPPRADASDAVRGGAWRRAGQVAKNVLMGILVPPHAAPPLCQFTFQLEQEPEVASGATSSMSASSGCTPFVTSGAIQQGPCQTKSGCDLSSSHGPLPEILGRRNEQNSAPLDDDGVSDLRCAVDSHGQGDANGW
eukprot:CAMPEP_0179096814 /NCGR_PEP_ID=MMETSP0796-20121207/44526_1 /TAXON_ID=73915 /ORGANISM="Pyrodinium bahamense, Strain pbaha01" /LENGTH=222 /DNA_ID=CAMNT_0020794541 /DNA_START=12 /DNA_END=680 /DNA_ORIENTATION=+